MFVTEYADRNMVETRLLGCEVDLFKIELKAKGKANHINDFYSLNSDQEFDMSDYFELDRLIYSDQRALVNQLPKVVPNTTKCSYFYEKDTTECSLSITFLAKNEVSSLIMNKLKEAYADINLTYNIKKVKVMYKVIN